MTYETVVAACATLQRPPVWGIARYEVGDRLVQYEISHDDIARDIDWAVEVLTEYGIGRGQLVLSIGSPGPDGPHINPFCRAANLLGATVGHSDTFPWEARRDDMYARRLPVAMVLGLPLAHWQGLVSGDMTAAISAVSHLLVRPDAVAEMTAAGLSPGVFVGLGPATAVSRPGRPGVWVDEREFAVAERDGELFVTVVGDRRARLSDVPTGRRGTVTPDGAILLG